MTLGEGFLCICNEAITTICQIAGHFGPISIKWQWVTYPIWFAAMGKHGKKKEKKEKKERKGTKRNLDCNAALTDWSWSSSMGIEDCN